MTLSIQIGLSRIVKTLVRCLHFGRVWDTVKTEIVGNHARALELLLRVRSFDFPFSLSQVKAE